MDIAFVTTYNAQDILKWSGLGYYMSKSLEDCGNRINYIGDLKKHFYPVNLFKGFFYSRILNQKFPTERTIRTSMDYAKEVTKSLSKINHDCILSPGTIPIAYLDCASPKVIYTDATFAGMLNYYDGFVNLSSETIRKGHQLEKQALDSCALAVYASEWAAQSAIKDYGTDPSKVKVVPFGANWDVQYTEAEIHKVILNRERARLKILFIGIDWKRKGGDLVLSTAKEIKKRGIDVELHVVGPRNPPFTEMPDWIIYHGFLSKWIPEQKVILETLFKSCHILFVPSKAEAFGCVFCEASLFGMPSFSGNTGGLTTSIIDGKNGFNLPSTATENNYADLIIGQFDDYDKYLALAFSAYNDYKTRLNWKTSGELLTNYLSEIRAPN